MINFKLRQLVGKICFVYLDDLIVFSSTYKEHLRNLEIIFERLRETKLSLQPVKCEYIQPELDYLGHLITTEGIKPQRRLVEKIDNFPMPKV